MMSVGFLDSNPVSHVPQQKLLQGGKVSKNVYLLWFVPEGEDGDKDGLLIGVYDTEVSAKAAIVRLEGKPGFSNFPKGFQIHSRELGQDSWKEGFIRAD